MSEYLYDRSQLIQIIKGPVEPVLGSAYQNLDNYAIRARLPLPPLLFLSGIVEINAKKGELTPASLVAEYVIPEDSLFCYDGVEVSEMVPDEASDVSIFLLSYMGVDDLYQGQRKFRFASARKKRLTDVPCCVGDILRIEFAIDRIIGHADNILTLCTYRCYCNSTLIIHSTYTAGLFTDEMLESAAGYGNLEFLKKQGCSYNAEKVEQFFDGNYEGCFGHGAGRVLTRRRNYNRQIRLIDEVTDVYAQTGIEGCGFIQATAVITEEFFAFDSHFINDPVLPGAILVEGLEQLCTFYAVWKAHKEGWSNLEIRRGQSRVDAQFGIQGQRKRLEVTYRIQMSSLIDENGVVEFVADAQVYLDGVCALKVNGMGTRLVHTAYKLSTQQQKMLVLDRVPGSQGCMNLGFAFYLQKKFDIQRLKEAIEKVHKEHEVLCSIIGRRGSQIYQQILSLSEMPLEIVEEDVTGLSDNQIRSKLSEFSTRPFELFHHRLTRTMICTNEAEEMWLLFVFHHTVFDGGSIGIFMEDLRRAYDGEQLSGEQQTFIEYCQEKCKEETREFLQERDVYWEQECKGLQPLIHHSEDFINKVEEAADIDENALKNQGSNCSSYHFFVSKEQMQKLNVVCRKEKASIVHAMMAAAHITLYRIYGVEDTSIIVAAEDRTLDTYDTCGCLSGCLRCRPMMSKDDTPVELIGKVKKKVLQGHKYLAAQFLPIHYTDADMMKQGMRSSQMEIMFSYQSFNPRGFQLNGMTLESYELESRAIAGYFWMNFYQHSEGIDVNVIYDRTMYNEVYLARFEREMLWAIDKMVN